MPEEIWPGPSSRARVEFFARDRTTRRIAFSLIRYWDLKSDGTTEIAPNVSLQEDGWVDRENLELVVRAEPSDLDEYRRQMREAARNALIVQPPRADPMPRCLVRLASDGDHGRADGVIDVFAKAGTPVRITWIARAHDRKAWIENVCWLDYRAPEPGY